MKQRIKIIIQKHREIVMGPNDDTGVPVDEHTLIIILESRWRVADVAYI